ncbi:MAG: hypothetical protein AB7K71_38085 [Polyangiaceae bacterium]
MLALGVLCGCLSFATRERLVGFGFGGEGVLTAARAWRVGGAFVNPRSSGFVYIEETFEALAAGLR